MSTQNDIDCVDEWRKLTVTANNYLSNFAPMK